MKNKLSKILLILLNISLILTTFAPYIAYAAESNPKKGDLKYDGTTAYVNVPDTKFDVIKDQYTSTNNGSVEVATGTYHTATSDKETTIRPNSDGTHNDVTTSIAKDKNEYLSNFDIEIRKKVTKLNDDGKYKVSFEVRGKGVEYTVRKPVYVVVVFDNSNSMAPSEKKSKNCKNWIAIDGDDNGGRCYDKWDSAVNGTKEFANTLLLNIPSAQISLVSFAGGTYTKNTSTCTGIAKIIKASDHFSVNGSGSNQYYQEGNYGTRYSLNEYSCNSTNRNKQCTQIYKKSDRIIDESGVGISENNNNYIYNDTNYSKNNYACVLHDTPYNDSKLIRNFANENLSNIKIPKPTVEEDIQIGGTNLEAGLKEALKLLQNNSSIPEDALKYVVVMGDGAPTYYYGSDGYTLGNGNKTTDAEIQPAYNMATSIKNQDIKIYSVGYEISNDTSAQTVLKNIASQADYYSSGDASGIAKLFTDIAGSITKEAGIHAIVTDKIGSAFTGSGTGVTSDTFTYGPIEKITNSWQSMGSFEIQIDRDSKTGWYPTNDGFQLTYYDNDNVLHTIYCDDNPEVYWKQPELTLTKKVEGFNGTTPDTSQSFEFTINVKNSKGQNISGEYTINSTRTGNKTITFDNNGNANISIYHNETITFYDLPYLAKYTIQENNTDGFSVETLFNNERKMSDIFEQTVLNDNQNVTFINTIGYLLPETGSSSGLILLIIGMLFTIAPVIYIGYILVEERR